MDKTKILIFGAHGLLGQNLVKTFAPDYSIMGVGIEPPGRFKVDGLMDYRLGDITNREQTQKLISEGQFAAVINAAAYTNVDQAEIDSGLATLLNDIAVGYMLEQFPGNTVFIHISTDYIFDGTAGPYREADPPQPRGIYAETKFAGEKRVLESGCKFISIRPNVLYGYGERLSSSFVNWLIGELKAGRPVRIVNDQYNNPTYAKRLAEAIRLLLETNSWGTWNFGSREIVSRLGFALKIADSFGLDADLIRGIPTAELRQQAPRPMKSGLICEKLENTLKFPILPIHEELTLLKEEMYAG